MFMGLTVSLLCVDCFIRICCSLTSIFTVYTDRRSDTWFTRDLFAIQCLFWDRRKTIFYYRQYPDDHAPLKIRVREPRHFLLFDFDICALLIGRFIGVSLSLASKRTCKLTTVEGPCLPFICHLVRFAALIFLNDLTKPLLVVYSVYRFLVCHHIDFRAVYTEVDYLDSTGILHLVTVSPLFTPTMLSHNFGSKAPFCMYQIPCSIDRMLKQ